MQLRARMYPPLWFLLFAAAAWLIAQWPLAGYDPVRPLWLIAALVAAAVLLAGTAVGLFRLARTTVDPFGESAALVTTGPYRFTRNPMYLAMLLALTAWVVWLAHPFPPLLIPLFIQVITTRQIHLEEQRLRRLFGVEYDDYCCRTRRWI